MDTATHDIYWGGNAFFNYPDIPNAYWVFRPDSDSDTIQGDVANCFFSPEVGRSAFGPATNPHPYLADGTPELSFEIYDIHTYDNSCTFSVRFLNQDIAGTETPSVVRLYPNPTSGKILLQGIDLGTPVRIYNTYGALLITTTYNGKPIDLSHLPSGLYMLATPTYTSKIIKN
jgi:hypothetical protein